MSETLQILEPFYLIMATLIGICVGSYSNAVIFRHGTNESPNEGRSHCMSCGHQLAWYDNIPLLSYMLLRGKCRYCKEKISIQYPIVEALNGLLYFLAFSHFGFTIDGFSYAILSTLCIIISIIDERTFKIPKSFTNCILAIGVIKTIALLIMKASITPFLIGMLSVSSVLFLIVFVSEGKAMGMGDVRMVFGCGLIVGFPNVFVGFLISCISACVIHSIRMKISNKSNKLSLGPYLAAGALLSAYIGQPLVDWYLKISGFM